MTRIIDCHCHIYPDAIAERAVAGISTFYGLPNAYNGAPFILTLSWNLASATAAKSLQSCPTLYDPIDGSPPGSPILGILQARMRVLEWVAISFSNA